MRIIIPKEVKFIIDKIYEYGFEAFIVGGCVRDSILGLKPNDYDITTSAKPGDIKKIFKEYKIIENGIKHGTVGVIIEKEVYEITTYRIESEYEDSRRPKSVEFTKNIVEDLKRRDFTINAMAYNDKEGLIDAFNGIGDLENKIIRTVGNPDERFTEDGLRIIRAVRFSCKLGFKIEEKTLSSIYKNANIIKNISIERITEEFTKAILSENPNNIAILFDSKILANLGIYIDDSEFNFNVIEKNINILKECEKDLKDRIVILEYLIVNERIRSINDENERIKYYNTYIQQQNIVNNLKYPNKLTNSCNAYLQCMILDEEKFDVVKIKKMINNIGIEDFLKVMLLKKKYYSNFKSSTKTINSRNKNDIIDKIISIVNEIYINKECYSIKDMDINGKILSELGYKGKEIGEKLNYLLEEVLKNPNLNKRIELIKLLEQ
ncbi:MAG: CCA tRNA nucleotidyltransferase [Peptostreptococcaceae bacterium]